MLSLKSSPDARRFRAGICGVVCFRGFIRHRNSVYNRLFKVGNPYAGSSKTSEHEDAALHRVCRATEAAIFANEIVGPQVRLSGLDCRDNDLARSRYRDLCDADGIVSLSDRLRATQIFSSSVC
jgi:uncharacterized protein YerC